MDLIPESQFLEEAIQLRATYEARGHPWHTWCVMATLLRSETESALSDFLRENYRLRISRAG